MRARLAPVIALAVLILPCVSIIIGSKLLDQAPTQTPTPPVQTSRPAPSPPRPEYYCDSATGEAALAHCKFGDWMVAATSEEVLRYCEFPALLGLGGLPAPIPTPLGIFCVYRGSPRLPRTPPPEDTPAAPPGRPIAAPTKSEVK